MSRTPIAGGINRNRRQRRDQPPDRGYQRTPTTIPQPAVLVVGEIEILRRQRSVPRAASAVRALRSAGGPACLADSLARFPRDQAEFFLDRRKALKDFVEA